MDKEAAEKLLDKAYTKALSEAIQIDEVVENPCRGEEDYRYRACFLENSGSAAITMEKLRDILVTAGFKTDSTGSMDGELDSVFILPNTSYELNSSFGSFGIEWVVYDNNIGFAAPRTNIDDPKAPHAIMSAQQFVKLQTLSYVRFALRFKDAKEYEAQFESCGEATAESASYCIKPLLTQKQVFQALAHFSTSGDIVLFEKLDQQETFEYHEEELIKKGIRDGVLSKNYKSDLTFTKVKSGLYTATNWRDYPAYKVTYELTPKGDKYAVKVTATRIPIDPKAQKKEGK